MVDMRSFWIGMAVGGITGFFVFSAFGRELVGTARRVGTAKARNGLKKWEKKHA